MVVVVAMVAEVVEVAQQLAVDMGLRLERNGNRLEGSFERT